MCADNYCHFIYEKIIHGEIHGPVAVESSFGWLVTGYFENVSTNTFVKKTLFKKQMLFFKINLNYLSFSGKHFCYRKGLLQK